MNIDKVIILLNKVYRDLNDEDLKLEVRYMIEDLQMYRQTNI
jgi:hypothetical protein